MAMARVVIRMTTCCCHLKHSFDGLGSSYAAASVEGPLSHVAMAALLGREARACSQGLWLTPGGGQKAGRGHPSAARHVLAA